MVFLSPYVLLSKKEMLPRCSSHHYFLAHVARMEKKKKKKKKEYGHSILNF